MATLTPNYKLKKPAATDFVDVQDLNDNADIIDTTLKAKADLADGKIPAAQIPSLGYVPTTRKVNGKELSKDITLEASDVDAAPTKHSHSDYVPTTRTVNKKPLSADISLDASDVSAIPNAQKGAKSGVASLDTNGKIPTAQLPDGLGILPRFDVTCTSGATVKVANGTTTLTKTSTGTVSFDLPNYGTWTVTVTQGSASKSIKVEVDTVKIYPIMLASLADSTWPQIAAASEAGLAESLWSVGDEKNITVGSEMLTLVIKGFNHDDLASGGKAGITFGLKNLMAATHRMEATSTNANGFIGSEMYSYLQDEILPTLPAELQTVIKSVKKKTSAGNKSTTINTDVMKLFLFSESEIFGTKTYSTGDEGDQYPYFATQQNRIKYLSNGSGSASFWWERSPYASGATNFCHVYSDGNANYGGASHARGVCFGFCV